MSEKVYEIIQEKILQKIEEGVVPWQRTWEGGGGIPRNIISNKPYKGFNHIMLICQGFTSPYWMTFNQIKQLKGKLIEGEGKNYAIITYWKMLEKENEDGTVEKRFPMIRYYRVYNLEQTEGIKSKWEVEIPKYNHNDPIKNCEQVLAEMRDMPETKWGMSPCYIPSKDMIGMPKIKNFASASEYYAAYYHEMAHSTKAMQRMNRDKHSYAKEELIAEMSACFLCGMTGIDTATIDNQAAYLKSWAKRIKGENVKMIVQAASEAQKVSDWIMNINEFTEMKKSA
ncbi:MAG: DUF1738 domain-containing protein [Deltaproteobacteria bacterium]|nr:DUF1738 domain-containing protein [Deltaproteobacteria bacterium]